MNFGCHMHVCLKSINTLLTPSSHPLTTLSPMLSYLEENALIYIKKKKKVSLFPVIFCNFPLDSNL